MMSTLSPTETVEGAYEALLTLPEVEALRIGKPILKGPTRLETRIGDTRDEKGNERRWRKAVIALDGQTCQVCRRHVVQQLALAGNQLHVHHVAPRADQAVRWDVRNGMVTCLECHEKLTPHSSAPVHLVILQAARFLFTVGDKTYINAREPVTFEEVA